MLNLSRCYPFAVCNPINAQRSNSLMNHLNTGDAEEDNLAKSDLFKGRFGVEQRIQPFPRISHQSDYQGLWKNISDALQVGRVQVSSLYSFFQMDSISSDSKRSSHCCQLSMKIHHAYFPPSQLGRIKCQRSARGKSTRFPRYIENEALVLLLSSSK